MAGALHSFLPGPGGSQSLHALPASPDDYHSGSVTGFCVPAHLTKEARIRHGLPVSPAPCPKTVFGRVRTGRTREHLPPHGGLSWLQIAHTVPARSRRARDQRGWLRAVLADPEMFPSCPVIRTGYDASPTDASQARRGWQGGGWPEDRAPARHAGPTTQIRDMSRPAGEDKPRRVTGCLQEALRQKGRPRNGAAHNTESDRIIVSPKGWRPRERTRSITQAEAHHTREPIGQSSIAPQRHAARVGRGAGWPSDQAISRLAIVKAIRPGSKRARDQRRYLRAVLADPVIAALRADRRRAVLELARILARHADWRTMTSWRPRERACAEIGSSRDPSKPLSISAYKAARRVLEERGFLGLVAQGWTSALRAAVLDDQTGTSAVFVLTVPRRKQRLPSDGNLRG